MTDKREEITAKEIRNILFATEKTLRNRKGYNKLHQKYLSKIQYMLMHLRLYPLTKDVMNNWTMPEKVIKRRLTTANVGCV